MNISSAIVHAVPGRIDQLRTALARLSGVEVHGVSPEGKFIVTIEADSDAGNVSLYESIGRLDCVMSAAMVYHQFEAEPDREVSVEPQS